MDEEKKRWSVTYTKHIRQKRKVYQDGFLDLYTSTNKVKLYDEFEKLLECKILKEDEVVISGETLTFSSYFVDVGDSEGSHKPAPDLSFSGSDKEIGGQAKSMCKQNFGRAFVSSDRKIEVEKKSAKHGSSSPSQKIIRDFKKRELRKYGTSLSSPDTTHTKTREWQVLYTTQLTQKAKKYHDGFLQLATCGSLGRQIKLFDETRKLLDSRFLKRDEVIKCEESITVISHLVEIGEENCKPLADLQVLGNNCNIYGKPELKHGRDACPKSNIYDKKEFKKIEMPGYGAPRSSYTKEWQVMYTTQVTQKAKRYHDGFIQLVENGSLQRQVMLYDDSKRLLNSRFLKKDEVIRSGESIAFEAHLVNIGEPHGNRQFEMDVNTHEKDVNVSQRSRMLHGEQNFLKASKSIIKGKPQNSACSRQNVDSTFSTVNEKKQSKSVYTDKPVRDAIQILSILQKPMSTESIDVGCTHNNMTVQLSSTKGLEVSDIIEDVCDNNQLPKPQSKSYENIDSENCPGVGSSKVSAGFGCQVSKDAEIGKSIKTDSDEKTSSNWNDETSGFGLLGTNVYASDDHTNDESIASKDHKTGTTMDEFPSFDLGF